MVILKELPVGVPMSQHLLDGAECFAAVKHFGCDYWVPITPKMKRLFGIHEIRGEFRVDHESLLDHTLSQVVYAVHLQVRDTIGRDVEQSIKRDVSERFERLFSDQMHNRVSQAMDDHLMRIGQEERDDRKE